MCCKWHHDAMWKERNLVVVVLCVMFCWETLVLGIHMDVTHVNVVAWRHYSQVAITPFCQTNAPFDTVITVLEWFEQQSIDLASTYPRSNRALLGIGLGD